MTVHLATEGRQCVFAEESRNYITQGSDEQNLPASGASMIARIWHGSTTRENADAYESHLKPELLPGLSEKKGFQRSYLLRRTVGEEVEFITIILFDSLDDVRGIAGQDYERAVIPADRLPLLSRHDAKAAHYEVVTTVDRA